MTEPAAADAQATVSSLVGNAQRLGLTWTIRPATVTSSAPQATFDGDSESIAMTPMTGGVAVGQRVYVFVVPPSGNYIIGTVTPVPQLRLRNPSFSLVGAVDQTISWDTQDQIAGGPWYTGALPVSTIMVPESGWYSIVAVLSTDTPGVANSRQMISIEPNIASGGLGGFFYRTTWGIGETNGSVSTLIPLTPDSTFTIHARQNSAGAMGAAATVVITKIFGL